jgi:hypothetical protein
VGNVHQLILDIGVEQARKIAFDKTEVRCVDTASSIMADARFDLKILHSGFAMTALPHRQTKELIWERVGGERGEIKLHVQSGHLADRTAVGLPYGSMARLILIHLCSEAHINKSRFVELGPSMSAFLKRMEVSIGGKSIASVRDQSRRISLCRLTFFNKRAKDTLISNGSFVRNAVVVDDVRYEQMKMWQDIVELDEVFFKNLVEHPLPVREVAIKALAGKSMALDIYVWLSYRLRVLERPTPLSWAAVYAQFGAGYQGRKGFVTEFKEPLKLALAAYPEAKVEISRMGLILHPSDSPVPKVHPIAAAKRIASF